MKDTFLDTPLGKKILTCIQCGTCSGSCPLAHQMDYSPRAVFAMIRDGFLKEALQSNTPWFCVSCYQCMSRCPQEIPVTDIMYRLKQMALKAGLAPRSNKMPDLYQAFDRNIEQMGRVSEPLIMAQYAIKHPEDAIKNMPLALRLLRKKRLEILPQKAESLKQFIKYYKTRYLDKERGR